ncbi:SDR family NAD(P)-dependent oxidoreductase [Suttonella sp. R2A3]|uniref:SDR family NAD(P)-dependent oxidoreductase n=1 Tax=Suttonella sp. R2A3 TaxID=2908648 RepID=UPI001F1D6E68|nr:SDR family NAD(P)-dependent oxidoreductase [Suttonella sp. R2A3]UJF25097.1 SDR family NAD(P)-dependent oxidoreductase [Suttonella sp. R2A3]
MSDTPRSILITGCSSGIGYRAAHTLHERGWTVIASARDAADVERLKSEGLAAVQLDLASPDSITMALDWTMKYTDGRLDALFNNGAFAIPGAVEDLSRSALAYQLDNGLLGWHDLTRRVLPLMRLQGSGRIVQNSSVLGLAAMRYRGAYCSMKFALEGLSDALRLELSGSGVYVSLIEPGPIRTEFRDNAFKEFQHWIDASHSLHKMHYVNMIQRLESDKPEPFTLEPDAVVDKLIHALEAKRPKPRYYVTKATWIMAILRRLLPTRWMDRFVLHLAEREGKRYR